MQPDDRHATGPRCEALAAGYLTGKGLDVRRRNLRTRLGEVDLLCRDGPVWVFIEVKARRSERFGLGVEAVDRRKQKRLLAIARLVMMAYPLAPYRFDVVTIAIDRGRPEIRHLVDAFRG